MNNSDSGRLTMQQSDTPLKLLAKLQQLP